MFQVQAHKKYKDKTLNNTKPAPYTIKEQCADLQGMDRSQQGDCNKHIQSSLGWQSFKNPVMQAHGCQIKTLESLRKVRSILVLVAVVVLVAQPYPTFCNHTDCSPPAFSAQGFSRPEYWSRQPFPSPGDLPDPGIELRSPELQLRHQGSPAWLYLTATRNGGCV